MQHIHIFVLFWVDFAVYNAPKQGAEVWSNVPSHKKAMVPLNRENMLKKTSLSYELMVWTASSMLINQ